MLFLFLPSPSRCFCFPQERSPVLFRRKRRILRIRGLLLAVAFGNCCPQTAHTAPTGPVTRFAGVRPPTWLSKPHTGSHRAEFGFFSITSLPLPLKGEGLGFIQFGVVWVPNAEKPDAFPQEKTDASYPRASLGSCLWQLLLTTGQHGFNGVDLGSRRWCSPT